MRAMSQALPPNRTGGHLWGQRRVSAKISLDALAAEAGVNKGHLSMMEHGRMIPTSAEYDAIHAALVRLESPTAEAIA
jgi:transcriptional regulator with XRE-family HTH domain